MIRISVPKGAIRPWQLGGDYGQEVQVGDQVIGRLIGVQEYPDHDEWVISPHEAPVCPDCGKPMERLEAKSDVLPDKVFIFWRCECNTTTTGVQGVDT